MSEIIKDLLGYYNKAPDPLLYKKACDIMGRLPESDQQKICDWILEHISKRAGLDVPTIRTAMSECGMSVSIADEQPREWTCDLCGTTYSRVSISNDRLRKQGLHDYCPRCGLSPYDTETALAYAKRLQGKIPDWYIRLKDDIRKNRLVPGARPRWDPKKDEEFEKEMRQKEIENMKAQAKAEVAQLTSAKVAVK